MSSFPISLVWLLFFSLWATYQEVQAQDLPPHGASFFDSLQSKIGIVYDGQPLPLEPHPFEVLLKRLNQHTPLYASVIPFGRSLQKMAAYPESLKFPRVVVTPSEQSKILNTHLRGRLFIAYAEATKKLEVMSFNPQLGRFEFQVVDNFYPGGKASARYVSRQLCLRCHQGGSPIFAGGEWLETTAFNADLAKATQTALGSKEYFGIPLYRDDPSSKYDVIGKPEHFEDMVRFGALLVGYQKAWQDICSASSDVLRCRKKLLKWMIVSNVDQQLSLEPDLELLQAFVSVLGQGTITIPSEKLPDHNPFLQGKLSYQMPKDIDPSLPREPMQLIMASQKDPVGLQFYKFHIFVKGMGQSFFTTKDFRHLRSLLASKWEKQSHKVDFQAKAYVPPKLAGDKICLPNADSLLQGLTTEGASSLVMPMVCVPRRAWKEFTEAIDGLPQAATAILSRETILQEFDKRFRTQYAQKICCQGQIPVQAHDTFEQQKILDPSLRKDPKLQGFFKYCSECHLYQDLPYPFLAGETEADVTKNLKSRASLIHYRLTQEQMPPHFAQQPLGAKERQALLQDLKAIVGD